MPHENKKTTSEKRKFGSNKKLGLEWTMNGLGKPFVKNPIQKMEKLIKNQCQIAACEQKNYKRESKFLFKHTFLTLTLKSKPLSYKTTRFFAPLAVPAWPKSLFQFYLKIMKMCEHILKKDSAPIQFNFFEL